MKLSPFKEVSFLYKVLFATLTYGDNCCWFGKLKVITVQRSENSVNGNGNENEKEKTLA